MNVIPSPRYATARGSLERQLPESLVSSMQISVIIAVVSGEGEVFLSGSTDEGLKQLQATGFSHIRSTYMSTNLDLIRSTYELGPSALLPALAADVEWTEAAGFPYAGTYRGADEIVKNVFARLGSEWEGFIPDLENLYDAGDTIIGTGFYRGTFRATNRPMAASFAHIFTLRDGKIVRFVQYVDSRKVWEAIEPK